MLRLLTAVALAVPRFTQAVTPPDSVVAFVDVSVIPMDREQVLAGQTVLVRDGHIVALGPAGRVKVPRGATRVDGRGKFLMPGLADMHAHIAWISDSAALRRYLFRFVATGVTTIRNMEGSPDVVAWRERVATGRLLGPRIYTATPYFNGHMRSDSVSAAVAEFKKVGYDFIKVKGIEPNVLDSLAAAAHRLGMPFAGHALLGGSTLKDALRAGFASVEHLDGYMWDALWPPGTARPRAMGIAFIAPDVSPDDPQSIFDFLEKLDVSKIPEVAAATKRAGVWNCPTLVAIQGASDSTDAEFWSLFTGIQAKLVTALHKAGAGLLLGTDGDPESIHQELQAFVAAGLTPYQALETGTRGPAMFWGTLDSTGTVAVGKRADLVLLSDNPLVNIRNTAKTAGVMVAGRWFPRQTIDVQKAADDAATAAEQQRAAGAGN